MRSLLKSRHWGLLVVALVSLLGLAVLGCDELKTTDGGTVATVGSITTGLPESATSAEIPVSSSDTLAPTTTLPPAATATTEALSSAETRLPSGHIKAMGFIDDVWEDASGRHLKIDYAEMLSGAAADAAAVAAGAILPGEHADNDYWISNVNPKLREFDISDSVVIITEYRNFTVTLPGGTPCAWADFLSFWGPGPLPDGDAHLPSSPWWIERDGNTIVWIRQQFLP
jgi:hypothetical protein